MRKSRLEAFSDGVLAIIITIMILEIKVPEGDSLHDLRAVIPKFLSYVMSFIFLAIYWNNHHHMMHTVRQVSGMILWANMHLLFWLSLVPFTTDWMGENNFSKWPMALYGIILLMSAIAYTILERIIISSHGTDSILARAIGKDFKGKISPFLYLLGIISSFINSWLAGLFYITVALIWLIPDRRIEIIFRQNDHEEDHS